MNNSDYTFYELLWEVPADKALIILAERGIKGAVKLGQRAKELYKTVSDERYRDMCIPSFSLNDCLRWMKSNRSNYPEAAYLFISVLDNPTPRNENDNFSLTMALVDKYKKPIYAGRDTQEIVCMVVPVGTIDDRLISALNGQESVIIKL